MIDKNKLFGLFGDAKDTNNGSEAVALFHANQELLETPFIKIGMFTKLIVNHWVFYEKLKQFLSKEQPDYNVEETKKASEFTVYNRAWHYIKQINIDKEDHLNAIIEFKKDPFIPALEAAINYFEDPDVEQYERCAFLFKILDLKKQV